MTNVAELREQLAELKAARRTGARSISFGAGPSSRTVEYRTDAEFAAAIADLEADLARTTGEQPARSIVVRGEKGWR